MAITNCIVCLEGCHGAGKTTQIELINADLSNKNSIFALPENFAKIGTLDHNDFITECGWVVMWFKRVATILSYHKLPATQPAQMPATQPAQVPATQPAQVSTITIVVDRSPYSALIYCNDEQRPLLAAVIERSFAELRRNFDFSLHMIKINVEVNDLLQRIAQRLESQPERKKMPEIDTTHTLRIIEIYAKYFTLYHSIDCEIDNIANQAGATNQKIMRAIARIKMQQ